MMPRWQAVLVSALAFALGLMVRAGDWLLLTAFLCASAVALLLGWWIGHADFTDAQERQVIGRAIERQRAQIAVAHANQEAAFRVGPAGDRHPSFVTRFDDEDGSVWPGPGPRWTRTR